MKINSNSVQKGYVLVMTLFMLVALTLIGMAAISFSTLDIDMAGNYRLRGSCFIAADAGVQIMMESLASSGKLGTTVLGVDRMLPGGFRILSGHYDDSSPSNILGIGKGSLNYANLAGWNRTNVIGFVFGGAYEGNIVAYLPGPGGSRECQQEIQVGLTVGTD